MTETIGYMLGALSFAGVLTGVVAFTERHSNRYTRRAIAHRIAHRLLAWEQGQIAKEKAVENAMAQTPQLIGVPNAE